MKHTPGPWKVVSHYVIVDNIDRGGVIAKLTGDGPIQWACEKGSTEIPYNALLIAAAPDLLKACVTALEWFIDMKTDSPYRKGYQKKFYDPIIMVLRQAISIAEKEE